MFDFKLHETLFEKNACFLKKTGEKNKAYGQLSIPQQQLLFYLIWQSSIS